MDSEMPLIPSLSPCSANMELIGSAHSSSALVISSCSVGSDRDIILSSHFGGRPGLFRTSNSCKRSRGTLRHLLSVDLYRPLLWEVDLHCHVTSWAD